MYIPILKRSTGLGAEWQKVSHARQTKNESHSSSYLLLEGLIIIFPLSHDTVQKVLKSLIKIKESLNVKKGLKKSKL